MVYATRRSLRAARDLQAGGQSHPKGRREVGFEPHEAPKLDIALF